jgi:Rv0078B-related antitoxin
MAIKTRDNRYNREKEIVMSLDPARYELIDDQMAEVLRAKTPFERLAMAESMRRMARGLIRDKLRFDHPDWTADQIDREVARRLLHGAG